jgi:hypothetical protein
MSACLPERSRIVDPRINDHSLVAAETEEKPQSAQKLSPPPMTMRSAERVAELKLGRVRIAWNLNQNQIQYPFEKLCLGVTAVGSRLLLFNGLNGVDQSFQSLTERGVCIQFPTISLDV